MQLDTHSNCPCSGVLLNNEGSSHTLCTASTDARAPRTRSTVFRKTAQHFRSFSHRRHQCFSAAHQRRSDSSMSGACQQHSDVWAQAVGYNSERQRWRSEERRWSQVPRAQIRSVSR
ncbi:hypothetical protein TRVL_09682 [Trypanosoma vivax]|nr:hypothetical protein TRVL_09682 [Trypanosoma vivax]